jgi:hypothetical protein
MLKGIRGELPISTSYRRQRDAVHYALCVECAKIEGVSLDWLLYGEGLMIRSKVDDENAKNLESTSTENSLREQIYEILESLLHEDLEGILNEAAHRQQLKALERQFETLESQFFENKKLNRPEFRQKTKKAVKYSE